MHTVASEIYFWHAKRLFHISPPNNTYLIPGAGIIGLVLTSEQIIPFALVERDLPDVSYRGAEDGCSRSNWSSSPYNRLIIPLVLLVP